VPPLLRRLVVPALSAVLAVIVAVPTTWYVATSRATGADPGPAVPTGPYHPDELRAELRARLPGGEVGGAVLAEIGSDADAGTETAVGLAPARYRVHLICGLLRRQGDRPAEVSFFLGTPDLRWRLVLPCPSTPLTMAQELDFIGDLAGAVSLLPDFTEDRPAWFVLLLRFVPVSGP
jgi:hypothetical protein